MRLTLREHLLKPDLEREMHRLERRRLVKEMAQRRVKVARLAKVRSRDQARVLKVVLMVSPSRRPPISRKRNRIIPTVTAMRAMLLKKHGRVVYPRRRRLKKPLQLSVQRRRRRLLLRLRSSRLLPRGLTRERPCGRQRMRFGKSLIGIETPTGLRLRRHRHQLKTPFSRAPAPKTH